MQTSFLQEALGAVDVVGWATHDLAGSSEAELCAELKNIGSAIGTLVPGRNGRMLELLRPLAIEEAAPRSLSKQYGRGPQPWHTDLAHRLCPARFVLLACVHPGRAVVATELSDTTASLEPCLAEAGKSEPFLVRGGRHAFYATVMDQRSGRVRYDPACMSPTSSAGSRLAKAIESQQMTAAVEWKQGHILILDNWRMLHRRQDASEATGRVLARVYVSEG